MTASSAIFHELLPSSDPPQEPAPLKRLAGENRTQLHVHRDLKEYGESYKPRGLAAWIFWDKIVRAGIAAYASEQQVLAELLPTATAQAQAATSKE